MSEGTHAFFRKDRCDPRFQDTPFLYLPSSRFEHLVISFPRQSTSMSLQSSTTIVYRSIPPALSDRITLEVYYGVSSPWALLGAPRVEAIAQRYGLRVHLKPIVVVEENGGIRVSVKSTWYRPKDELTCSSNLDMRHDKLIMR